MKFLFLLLVIFIAQACGAKKLAVSHADLALEHQIEKRLPLYTQQKKNLAKDIDQFLNHQKLFAKEAMPIISSVEIDVAQVDSQYDHLNALYMKLAANFNHLFSKHMALLDKEQQADFFKKLKEENGSIARADAEKRMGKVFNRFETIFGTISDKQKEIFVSFKDDFEQRDTQRLNRREALQEKFTSIYKLGIPRDEKAKKFNEAFLDYQTTYPSHSQNREIIKKIIPTLNPEQKKVFRENIEELKELLKYYLDQVY